jgi:hypothetical protein
MKSFVTKMFLTSLVLSTLIGAEAACAQTYRSAPTYRDVESNARAEGRPVTRQPNDVVSGHRVIGRDPDPFIRGEILRHSDSGWPD